MSGRRRIFSWARIVVAVDGYDFINAAGSCLVEQSISFRNGWEPDTNTAAGNGAGFKAGGYGSPPNTPAGGAATHTVQQCVSFSNRSQGYYANQHLMEPRRNGSRDARPMFRKPPRSPLEKELTQEDVASKVRVSKQHVSDVENGRRKVSIARAVRWAKALGYPVSFFVRMVAQEEIDAVGVDLKVVATDAA